jgi:hypothetical protein
MDTYPIAIGIETDLEPRNRLTTAFRAILAIPHLLLVGGGGSAGVNNVFDRGNDPLSVFFDVVSAGVLYVALSITTVISWFAILFTGRMPEGLWTFGAFVIGWQYRVQAYTALLTDRYPPFGDVDAPESYPASILISRPEARNRLTVAFRLFMIIPHAIVLFFIGIGAFVVAVIAWFAILLTGKYPDRGMFEFAAGALAWGTRLTAYMHLLTDEFPPFSLEYSKLPGGAALPPPAPATI